MQVEPVEQRLPRHTEQLSRNDLIPVGAAERFDDAVALRLGDLLTQLVSPARRLAEARCSLRLARIALDSAAEASPTGPRRGPKEPRSSSSFELVQLNQPACKEQPAPRRCGARGCCDHPTHELGQRAFRKRGERRPAAG